MDRSAGLDVRRLAERWQLDRLVIRRMVQRGSLKSILWRPAGRHGLRGMRIVLWSSIREYERRGWPASHRLPSS